MPGDRQSTPAASDGVRQARAPGRCQVRRDSESTPPGPLRCPAKRSRAAPSGPGTTPSDIMVEQSQATSGRHRQRGKCRALSSYRPPNQSRMGNASFGWRSLAVVVSHPTSGARSHRTWTADGTTPLERAADEEEACRAPGRGCSSWRPKAARYLATVLPGRSPSTPHELGPQRDGIRVTGRPDDVQQTLAPGPRPASFPPRRPWCVGLCHGKARRTPLERNRFGCDGGTLHLTVGIRTGSGASWTWPAILYTPLSRLQPSVLTTRCWWGPRTWKSHSHFVRGLEHVLEHIALTARSQIASLVVALVAAPFVAVVLDQACYRSAQARGALFCAPAYLVPACLAWA